MVHYKDQPYCLQRLGACEDAILWAKRHPHRAAPQALWEQCEEAAWCMWLVARVNTDPKRVFAFVCDRIRAMIAPEDNYRESVHNALELLMQWASEPKKPWKEPTLSEAVDLVRGQLLSTDLLCVIGEMLGAVDAYGTNVFPICIGNATAWLGMTADDVRRAFPWSDVEPLLAELAWLWDLHGHPFCNFLYDHCCAEHPRELAEQIVRDMDLRGSSPWPVQRLLTLCQEHKLVSDIVWFACEFGVGEQGLLLALARERVESSVAALAEGEISDCARSLFELCDTYAHNPSEHNAFRLEEFPFMAYRFPRESSRTEHVLREFSRAVLRVHTDSNSELADSMRSVFFGCEEQDVLDRVLAIAPLDEITRAVERHRA